MAPAYEDQEYARNLWVMCARDLKFFINTFVYTVDQRRPGGSVVPFVIWPYQDEIFDALHECTGNEDLRFEKSRDMGLTWCVLIYYAWLFAFHPLKSLLCASRKEDLVDSPGDSDCLFWKLDFIFKYLPGFLRPNYTRRALNFSNEDNGSSIDGCSTTGDLGRGGRRTSVFLDEFAAVGEGYAVLMSTRDVTKSRVFVSTPKGTGNAFSDLRNSAIRNVRVHWTAHPHKAVGIYYDHKGRPRSPWYDNECKRAASPIEIAQELDIDYLGSTYRFFDADVLDRVRREHVREPLIVGDIDCDEDGYKTTVARRNGGPLSMWVPVLYDGLPARGRYVIGIDVATGSRDTGGRGASNSVASIGDVNTWEKVGEYAVSGMEPTKFADKVLALARMFRGADDRPAYLIWEANGPGKLFGNRVVDQGFGNFYFREREKQIHGGSPTREPGWWANPDTRVALLGEYRRALGTDYINRSLEAVNECNYYVYLPNGDVRHDASITAPDPTGARENHGDRVVGDALSWKALKMMRAGLPKIQPNLAGFKARQAERRHRRLATAYW